MPQPLPNWRRHHKLPMRVNGNAFYSITSHLLNLLSPMGFFFFLQLQLDEWKKTRGGRREKKENLTDVILHYRDNTIYKQEPQWNSDYIRMNWRQFIIEGDCSWFIEIQEKDWFCLQKLFPYFKLINRIYYSTKKRISSINWPLINKSFEAIFFIMEYFNENCNLHLIWIRRLLQVVVLSSLFPLL